LSSNHCVLAQVSTLVQQQQQKTTKKKNNQVSWAFFSSQTPFNCFLSDFFFVFQFSINILGFFTLLSVQWGGGEEKSAISPKDVCQKKMNNINNNNNNNNNNNLKLAR